MKMREQRHRNCRGTSTLEFLVVLPLLLFIFLTGVELSRALMTLNVVVAAARDGARVGAVTDPWDPTPAMNRINAVLAAAGLASVTPTSVTSLGTCDSQVTTTVTVNFSTLFPGMLPMLTGPIPATNTTVMRYEGGVCP